MGRRPYAEGKRPKVEGRRHCIRIDGLSLNVWDKNQRAVHSLPFLQRPTVTIMFVLMASQFRRLWWPVREEAESDRNRSQSISIVLGFQIIYNWASILWIAKNEILDCDRILRFRKWPFRPLWASGWIVEASRAWVGACPRLQTQNLSVGR